MIHLAGPVLLAAVLSGAGVYGLLARRNAVLVLIGAELLLNAVNVLLVTAGSLPAGGLSAVTPASGRVRLAAGPPDPLLPGQVLAIVVITIAAAEIGVALAVVLLVFRQRGTVDLTALRELGEASSTFDEHPRDGEFPPSAATPERSAASQPSAAPQPSGERTR
jgi:NADH-quinone oxidoreductase subunit K